MSGAGLGNDNRIDVDRILATEVTSIDQARELRTALTALQKEALEEAHEKIAGIQHDRDVAQLKDAFEDGKWLKMGSDMAAAAAGMVACNASLDPIQRILVGGTLIATAVAATTWHVSKVSKQLYGTRGLADRFSPKSIWDNSVIWAECVLANQADANHRASQSIPEDSWLQDKSREVWRIAKTKAKDVLENPSTYLNLETLKIVSKKLLEKTFDASASLATKAMVIGMGQQILTSTNPSTPLLASAVASLAVNRGVHALTGAMGWSFKAIDAAAAMTGVARYLSLEGRKGFLARGVARVVKALDNAGEQTSAIFDDYRRRGQSLEFPEAMEIVAAREEHARRISGGVMFNRLNELREVALQAREKQTEQALRDRIIAERGNDFIDDVAGQAPKVVEAHDENKNVERAIASGVGAVIEKAADKGIDSIKDVAANAIGTKAAEKSLAKALDKVIGYGLGM